MFARFYDAAFPFAFAFVLIVSVYKISDYFTESYVSAILGVQIGLMVWQLKMSEKLDGGS